MTNNINKTNILIIEDDIAQYTMLKAYLETQSFNTHNIKCIKEFEDIIRKVPPNIIILDLNLPDGDGLILVKRICNDLKIPLIIVSTRHTSMDRILGLELGADDYISKPYHPRELLVRVNKLLDRYKIMDSTNNEIQIGTFKLNEEYKCLYDKDRNIIQLTSGEYSIIAILAKADGRVISRSKLIETAFSRIEYPTDRSVDVLISRIRKKLKTSINDNDVIDTVKGFGYRIKKI